MKTVCGHALIEMMTTLKHFFFRDTDFMIY